jgi:uncharacterized membrane protein YidH (DUF202 family)
MVEVDPGAGNERTALAWQRTALALVAGSVILSRLTFDRLGPAALISVVLAGPTGVWIFLEGRARYRHRATTCRGPGRRDGRATLTLTLATLAVGVTELLALAVD